LGGKDGSRGYLYQTFASIFEALCQDNWDKIYVEYSSGNDKVDIALESDGTVFKSIQVKSNINTFDRGSIINWTRDLIEDDVGASECELFLIGQLAPSAIEFKNAIVSLRENNNDKTKLGKENLNALSNFDTSTINGKTLKIINYPFELKILTNLLIASLLEYLSTKEFALMYDQLKLISKAIVADNFLFSLGNNGIEKSIFDSQIEEYVLMLKNRCFGFKAIGVVSFERGTEYLSEATETILSFKEKFDGRKLKPEYDWDRDVYQELDTFLKKNTDVNYNYQLMLEAPLSDWKDEPLLIPDREADSWDKAHPLEQIRWTVDKNKRCNSHYINVVKALKWWKKVMCADMKHPKSYPLEHFIGDCCPDNIESVAEGVVLTLEKIVTDYPFKPFLADRGVSEHNVFGRLSDEDYGEFYQSVCDAAKIAREAFDCEDLHESVAKWRKLFGTMFPESPTKASNSVNGFSKRTEKTTEIPRGRFA